jgi:hypothetical protein
MSKPAARTYVTLAAALFLLDWALGVGRLHWPELRSLLLGLNFPTAIGF